MFTWKSLLLNIEFELKKKDQSASEARNGFTDPEVLCSSKGTHPPCTAGKGGGQGVTSSSDTRPVPLVPAAPMSPLREELPGDFMFWLSSAAVPLP